MFALQILIFLVVAVFGQDVPCFQNAGCTGGQLGAAVVYNQCTNSVFGPDIKFECQSGSSQFKASIYASLSASCNNPIQSAIVGAGCQKLSAGPLTVYCSFPQCPAPPSPAPAPPPPPPPAPPSPAPPPPAPPSPAPAPPPSPPPPPAPVPRPSSGTSVGKSLILVGVVFLNI